MRPGGRSPVAGAAGAAAIVLTALGCAVGPEQEPGCHADADCGAGWVCSAGACFQTTTPETSEAPDGGDTGDAGDAGG